MKAIVLAGGGGTRLRPLTYTVPKSLVPVMNRPLIAHVIEQLRRHGVDEVVLAVSASDRRLAEAIGDGQELGVSVSYSYEEQPLGSGLAVKQAAAETKEAFFVCNGDIISNIDLTAMRNRHREKGALLTISLVEVEEPSAFGVVALGEDDRITRFVEKPPKGEEPSKLANAGVWLFEPAVLDAIPEERGDGSLERRVFPRLIEAGRYVQGYRTAAYWMDVGTPERYLALHAAMLAGRMPDLLSPRVSDGVTVEGGSVANGSTVGPGCRVAAGSSLAAGSEIAGYSVLGPGCEVAEEATVSNSVLWSGVRIGAKAVVSGSIVGNGCSIGPGAQIEGAVIADGVSLGPGTRLQGSRLGPGSVL